MSEVNLAPDSSYIIGRGSSADIKLDNEARISREHFSLTITENNECLVSLVSEKGHIFIANNPITTFTIKDEEKISLFPYTFEVKRSDDSENLIEAQSEELVPTNFNDEPESIDALDQTRTNFTQIEIYLSVWGDSVKKQFKLTGDTWTVGRDEYCDITINHPQLSRRHFEIKRENSEFIIFDLDSSNGTMVNGAKATASNPLPLSIGDKITVESLNFEISEYDALFEEHLSSAQSAMVAAPGHIDPLAGMPLPAEHIGASVLKVNSDGSTSKVKTSKFTKKHIVRAIAVIGILGAVAVEMTKGKSSKDERTPASVNEVTAEQKAFYRDTLQLAKHHFMEGRYSLCSSEIKKIHDKTDSFENSKDISSLCKEATGREKILADERRKKEQKSQVEEEVEALLSKCRSLARSSSNIAKLTTCLEPVLDLDPTNQEATDLVSTLQEKVELDRRNQINRKKRAQLIGKSKRQFKSAKSLFDKGELKSARAAYKRYLKSGLPDPGGLKSEAKRDIASIDSKVEALVNAKIEDCQSMQNSGNYKGAITACDIALREDSNNAKAKDLKKQATLQLRKGMQEIYQKSILEENYGNLKVAQKAWHSILEKDTKDGEYYLKAKTKLKKYGH